MPRIVNVDEMLLWARRNGYPIPNNVLWLLCHYPEVKDSYHDPETHDKRTETHGVCLDVISRQAAIDAIKEDKIDLTNPNVVAVFKATGDFEKVETQVMTCDRHIEILKDLPPAQPKRKTVDLKIEKISKHQSDFSDLYAQHTIPLPHGRLIDADALISELTIDPVECPGCPEPEYLEEFIDLLEGAPTVIEAEE